MSRFTRAFLATVSFLAVSAVGASSEPNDTNFFPIMAWNSVPKDPAVLHKMREAGLTVAGFASPGTLEDCQAAGLKAILSDARASGYDWTHVIRLRLTSARQVRGKYALIGAEKQAIFTREINADYVGGYWRLLSG